jgi:hypothetical protein
MLITSSGITEDDGAAAIRRKLAKAHKLAYGKLETAQEPEPEADAYGRVPENPPPARPTLPTVPTTGTNGKRFTPEQFQKAAVAKPTSRGRKEPKSKETAVKAVAREMQEKGITEADFYYEEEGLPD